MDPYGQVNEIIRLPLLNPIEDLGLDDPLTDCRGRYDCWKTNVDECRKKHKEASYGLSSDAKYLMRGICCICAGASHQAGDDKNGWSQALTLYRQGREILKCGKYEYGHALALLAWGLAYQMGGKSETALKLYELSYKIFEDLRKHYELQHDPRRTSQCSAFCGRLQTMMYRVNKAPGLPILLVNVTAGEPLYLPGEDFQSLPIHTILKGSEHEFLSWKDRQRITLELNPEDLYCVVTVRGDSMTGEDVKILDGDLLLVRKCENVPNRRIAVFQYEDYQSIVKRFRSEGDRKWLESANPDYNPLPVTASTKVLGLVEAILEKAKG